MENKNSNLVNGFAEKETFDFSVMLEIVKTNIAELIKSKENFFVLQKESREMAKSFIDKCKHNKVELGKMVSWLGDVMTQEELVSIVGNLFTKKKLLNVNLNVHSRLLHNDNEPESNMNDRIIDLVNVLNVYNYSIENFDSIEIPDD